MAPCKKFQVEFEYLWTKYMWDFFFFVQDLPLLNFSNLICMRLHSFVIVASPTPAVFISLFI